MRGKKTPLQENEVAERVRRSEQFLKDYYESEAFQLVLNDERLQRQWDPANYSRQQRQQEHAGLAKAIDAYRAAIDENESEHELPRLLGGLCRSNGLPFPNWLEKRLAALAIAERPSKRPRNWADHLRTYATYAQVLALQKGDVVRDLRGETPESITAGLVREKLVVVKDRLKRIRKYTGDDLSLTFFADPTLDVLPK